jgi:glucosyl-3-phosphoglycerate synthase
MVILDMDDTILRGRFVDHMAQAHHFTEDLAELRRKEKDPVILTKRIGLLLKGRTIEELLQAVSSIPLVDDIIEVVKTLKERGYIVGIISNSYLLITNYIRQIIGADFSYANKLEYYEGRATGEVNIPSYFFASPESTCGHGHCKTNAMEYACKKYLVQLKNVIAVGDSADDRCMVSYAGKGFAFCSSDEVLRKLAYQSIDEPSFQTILECQ